MSKVPGTTATIQWHQDYSYWPLDTAEGVTLWVTLDDADLDNGCLRYIPGSHRAGERQPADFIRGTGQPPRPGLPPMDANTRGHEAVDAPARAGEVLAHHALIYHMSGPNLSTRQRRGWSLNFVPAHARWTPDHAPHPYNYALMPARGAELTGERFPRFHR